MCDMCNSPEHHDKSEIERKAICKRERKNAHRLYAMGRMELSSLKMNPYLVTNPIWQNPTINREPLPYWNNA